MITEVRERRSRETGLGDTCGCGALFLYIAFREDGTFSFFWCSRCDIAKVNK